ncbi:MAG: hypothetical protein WC716_11820 [Chitinophagaceae bacterium]|jgi:hypothetical protein
MKLELTEEEIEDIRKGLIIAIHKEDNDRTKKFFDRIEAIMDKLDTARGLYNPNKKPLDEKRPLSVKVLGMFVAVFLDPTLNGGNMIMVFDIVEHNPDGRSRLQRLIEEKCTIELTPQQMEEAIELLNDYPVTVAEN